MEQYEVRQLEQSLLILAMPNLLQNNIQKSEDYVIENQVLSTSCENSEPSLITLENESQGNAHDAKLIEGESSLDVLNFSTNHAMTQQHLVNTKTELPLS